MIYNVGQILDRNLLIVEVQEGGMAFVYVVEDTETGKRAAVKTMREELLSDASMVARFRREMKIWVGMGIHPNVVRTFFVRDIGAQPFLFMEYMDGGSLLGLIEEGHPLGIDQILQVSKKISSGMNHVHNRITPDGVRGILHRDLKPTNILLNNRGEVKVADFGLARALNTTLLTQTYDVVGTIHYSSPEQILDSRSVDKRADIYSFGAILYHMTCGVLPFQGETWSDLVNQIRTVVPTHPGELRQDSPEPLSRLIMKCLAKPKEGRYESFDEIDAILSGLAPHHEGDTGRSGNATKELHDILDLAKREAVQGGYAAVEPAHLLLSAVLCRTEPLASWLEEMQVDKEKLVHHIRRLIGRDGQDLQVTSMTFKRSFGRVMGLVYTLAEKDGLSNPCGRHVLKALFRESAVRELMANAWNLVHTEDANREDLFDEIDGLLEIDDM